MGPGSGGRRRGCSHGSAASPLIAQSRKLAATDP